MAALRMAAIRRRAFRLAHLPYAAAAAFFVCLKLSIPAGHAPVLTAEAGRLLLANIPATLSGTVGRLSRWAGRLFRSSACWRLFP